MKVVGLITEYNPFHNGHKYHIEKAKEVTGADYAVVIMSGDYVQRGTPAIMPKRLRTQIALHCGADAVFELPVTYATGSAEYFAEGSVSFLHQLHIVDYLCFGSESNDLEGLKTIADVLANEPESYKLYLQSNLKNGLSFPAARQKALTEHLKDDRLCSLLSDPNNILGIEYLKALKKLNSPIIPYTIQREGAHYHEENLVTNFSSASAIRNLLCNSSDFSSISEEIKNHVPVQGLDVLTENHSSLYPVYPNDFSLLFKYHLLEETPETLIQYADVSEELANRIYKHLSDFVNIEHFCGLIKTKELTHTRIQRALMHILLKIKTKEIEGQRQSGYHCYARLLGFRKDSAGLISAISKKSNLTLVTKPADIEKLSDNGRIMLQKDIFASNLYASVITDKFNLKTKNEYQYPVVKV